MFLFAAEAENVHVGSKVIPVDGRTFRKCINLKQNKKRKIIQRKSLLVIVHKIFQYPFVHTCIIFTKTVYFMHTVL